MTSQSPCSHFCIPLSSLPLDDTHQACTAYDAWLQTCMAQYIKQHCRSSALARYPLTAIVFLLLAINASNSERFIMGMLSCFAFCTLRMTVSSMAVETTTRSVSRVMPSPFCRKHCIPSASSFSLVSLNLLPEIAVAAAYIFIYTCQVLCNSTHAHTGYTDKENVFEAGYILHAIG